MRSLRYNYHKQYRKWHQLNKDGAILSNRSNSTPYQFSAYKHGFVIRFQAASSTSVKALFCLSSLLSIYHREGFILTTHVALLSVYPDYIFFIKSSCSCTCTWSGSFLYFILVPALLQQFM